MKEPMKNISKSVVLTLKSVVNYQDGQVVSKSPAQNDAVSNAIRFDKDEENQHTRICDESCLDGVGHY